MHDLKGKVAVVTGGSRGIGRTICFALAEAGADVAVCCKDRVGLAVGVSDALKKEFGVRSVMSIADITNVDAVAQMAEYVRTNLGRCNILVNNAGVAWDKRHEKMSRELWDRVINTNLSGTFNVTKAFDAEMVESGWGRIINISSIVGQMGNYGQTNYAASKAGLEAYTRSLACELARKNITVNAVAPGFIETDMTRDLPEAVKMQVAGMTPMGRMGKAEEVAAVVRFLVSPAASYVTGQVIAVNGGMYM